MFVSLSLLRLLDANAASGRPVRKLRAWSATLALKVPKLTE